MLQHLAKGTAAQAQKLATRSDSSSDFGIGTSLKDGGEKIARLATTCGHRYFCQDMQSYHRCLFVSDRIQHC